MSKSQNPLSVHPPVAQPLPNMDGQDFLARWISNAPDKFEGRFARISQQLGLGALLTAEELNLLYEAAFYSTLCNIAFNGLGGCEGIIRPERESTRIKLEQGFMEARDNFLACTGWKKMHTQAKRSVQRVFLNVYVLDENLAE